MGRAIGSKQPFGRDRQKRDRGEPRNSPRGFCRRMVYTYTAVGSTNHAKRFYIGAVILSGLEIRVFRVTGPEGGHTPRLYYIHKRIYACTVHALSHSTRTAGVYGLETIVGPAAVRAILHPPPHRRAHGLRVRYTRHPNGRNVVAALWKSERTRKPPPVIEPKSFRANFRRKLLRLAPAARRSFN